MCGICGFYADPAPDDVEGVLRRMMAPMYLRGPDEEGTYVHREDGGVLAFGFRRLAIVDLEGGSQPMMNEDGSMVVMQNGEIYNYIQLRERLEKEHRFRTLSDTETLVHLYEERGEEFIRAVNGMFALALFDRNRKRLLLARDRLGKKPLYYRRAPGVFYFASELNSLMNYPGSPCAVNPDALAALFSFLCIPAPLTIYKDVWKLEPGRMLSVSPHDMRSRRFWDFPKPDGDAHVEKFEEKFRDLFFDAVSIRLRCDVSMGVLLSGGMDSTAVLGAAARFQPGLRSLTASFADTDQDESRYAGLAARTFGSQHNVRQVGNTFQAKMSAMMDRFGEPFGDSSFFPTYDVCALAGESVKMVLTGDGADELFGGYRKNKAARLLDLLRSPTAAFPRTSRALSRLHRDVRRLMKGLDVPFYETYVEWESGTTFGELRSMFVPEILKEVCTRPQDLFDADSEGLSFLERSLSVDTRLYLPNDLLAKMDMGSMAASIEARSPYLDYRLVELVHRLPLVLRAPFQGSKTLMRESLGDLIPRPIARRRKHGFTVPLERWLKELLKDPEADPLSRRAFQQRAIYRHGAITARLDRFLKREKNTLKETNFFWNLVVLETWFQLSEADNLVSSNDGNAGHAQRAA